MKHIVFFKDKLQDDILDEDIAGGETPQRKKNWEVEYIYDV